MMTYTLTNAQARRFLLRKHGLIGDPIFAGKQGVVDYIRQCGCIQFDPIDVCGKNAELVLQSRVEGFTKAMLDELLYQDRLLIDYFDKNLAIMPVETWPYFARERARHRQSGRSFEAVEQAAGAVWSMLEERPYVCSADLGMEQKVPWYWNETRLSRAVLESLYFRGELCVHHKKGTNKHYAPATKMLPEALLQAPDPHPDDDGFRDWLTLRRIGAVGLLCNRASDAFLCVDSHKNGGREAAFESLMAAGRLIEVDVEGMGEPLYARSEDAALLDEILSGQAYAPRMELLAPLDCFLWDRKLIRRLFDFDYTWEIYTPQAKRKYGYYVLPILRGEALAGRVEAVVNRKERMLRVEGLWWEKRSYLGDLRKCLKRFARFNGCTGVDMTALQ